MMFGAPGAGKSQIGNYLASRDGNGPFIASDMNGTGCTKNFRA
jgi:shikimate kinase